MKSFEELNKINVNNKVDKKNGLNYLSWSYAIEEITKQCPDFSYEFRHFKNDKGEEVPYMYDEKTGYMVETRCTIDGKTKSMMLPVMDYNNYAMKDHPYQVKTKYKTNDVAPATMCDINKTLMRCLVKNIAMFGLGLYIYAGEDIPNGETDERWEGLNEINNK